MGKLLEVERLSQNEPEISQKKDSSGNRNHTSTYAASKGSMSHPHLHLNWTKLYYHHHPKEILSPIEQHLLVSYGEDLLTHKRYWDGLPLKKRNEGAVRVRELTVEAGDYWKQEPVGEVMEWLV